MELLTALIVGVLLGALVTTTIMIIVLFKQPINEKQLQNHLQETTNSDEKSTIPYANCLLETIINDDWTEDASVLIPLCVDILTNCKALTERLTTVFFLMVSEDPSQVTEITTAANLITRRVDQLILSIRCPLNAQVLEEKSNVLTSAIIHLVTLSNAGSENPDQPQWMSTILSNVQGNLKLLHQIANNKKETFEMVTI